MNTLTLLDPLVTNNDSIDILNLGMRARNVLGANNITSVKQLANYDANQLRLLRNAGEGSWQEFGRALLKRFITPTWLIPIASGYHYPEAEIGDEDELNGAGWNRVTSDYSRAEYWMLERVAADLERGGIEYKLVRKHSGGNICIYRKGGISLPDSLSDED